MAKKKSKPKETYKAFVCENCAKKKLGYEPLDLTYEISGQCHFCGLVSNVLALSKDLYRNEKNKNGR